MARIHGLPAMAFRIWSNITNPFRKLVMTRWNIADNCEPEALAEFIRLAKIGSRLRLL